MRAAEEALDLLRLKTYVERFDGLIVQNQHHYAVYREVAKGIVESAASLWADRISAMKLAEAIRPLRERLNVPLDQKYMEGSGALPHQPDLNDRISRALNDRSGRGAERFVQ